MFFTNPLLIRMIRFGRPGGGPDKYWRVQQFLRLSWNFRGRKQNCYRIGARYVNKALMYGTINRVEKKKMMRDLWEHRIDAAVHEHDMHRFDFLEGLSRCDIRLDRKVLTDIAIYEPRTFQSLTEVAKYKLDEDRVPRRTFWERAIKRIF